MSEQIVNAIRTERAQKIKKLKQRQEKREASGLYHPDSKEGYDYIVCPIAEVRFTKIKKGHITGTLGMTEDEYYTLFPELKGKVAQRLKDRISQGQKTKMAYYDDGTPVLDDQGNHMTGDQWGRQKAHKTLNEIDPVTGKRRYDMLGEKTRNTHMSNVDEYGLNGYQRIAKDAIQKGNKTKAEKYGYRFSDEIDLYDRYDYTVTYVTNRCDVDMFRKGNGVQMRRDGGANSKQVDHLYSRKHGFENNVSVLCIARPENTRIIQTHKNELKNSNSTITKEKLFELTNYDQQQSAIEFELFKMITERHRSENQYHSTLDVFVEMIDALESLNDRRFDESIKFMRYMLDKDNYRK